jgi:hypothetical protein
MLKTKLTYLASTLGIAMMLGACQPTTPPAEPKTETAASEVQVVELSLEGELQKLNLNLAKCDGNNCSSLDIERLQSNMPFIDQWIDQQITVLLKETLADAPEQAAASEPVESSASEAAPISAKLKLEQQLKPYSQAFVALDDELKALSAGHPINIMIKPKILNAKQPLATVVLNSSSYLGGAHGSTTQRYYNFDLDAQKRVTLNDILQANQQTALKQKAYDAFRVWVIQTELASNVKEYEQAWQFNMTDNFYLGQQGLILQYGEYEIGPYVVGLPRLTIPYSELKGILKAQYLPQNANEAASEVNSSAEAQ